MPVKSRSNVSGSVLSFALILGLGATLAVPHGVAIWPVIFSLLGLMMLIGRYRIDKNRIAVEIREAKGLLAITAGLAILVPLCVDFSHGNSVSFDPYITLLLLPALSIVVFRTHVQAEVFFYGVALAAVSAFAQASFEVFFQDIQRARGYMNPIPFGDVCVLFALTLIVRATSVWRERPVYASVLLIGIICATYGSLLSGSKGGWLALLAGIVIGLWRLLESLKVPPTFRIITILIFFTMGQLLVPDSAKQRVVSGFHGAITWFRTGEISEGSVAARLELWSWGLLAIKKSPVTGLSREELLKLRVEAVADGRLNHKIFSYPTTKDNEFINQAATRGILGLIVSVATFVVPFWVFRRFRQHPSQCVRDLSLVGQLLPIAFIEFGLSVSIWGTSTFRFVYIAWVVLLLAMIAVHFSEGDQTGVRR